MPNTSTGNSDNGRSARQERLHKAAKVLLALGEDNAARVLQHLDQEMMERLVAEILQIQHIDQEERVHLLKDFKQVVESNAGVLTGGKAEARDLLVRALGEREAARYLEKLEKAIPVVNFAIFEDYPAATIANVLGNELAQTGAVVLSNLNARFAAQVLKELPREHAAKVARKIAHTKSVHPDALQATYDALLAKLEKLETEETVEPGGEDRLTAILGHMDFNSEDNILEELAKDEPDMADRIRHNLFVFEDLVNLEQREVRTLFEELPENRVWAYALKGALPELLRFVLSCVSVNRAKDIADDMKVLGPLPLSEIENHRNMIMHAAHTLNRRGEIILHKDREEFVE